jgi:hypothetical protein
MLWKIGRACVFGSQKPTRSAYGRRDCLRIAMFSDAARRLTACSDRPNTTASRAAAMPFAASTLSRSSSSEVQTEFLRLITEFQC